jgi:hypothetical protein
MTISERVRKEIERLAEWGKVGAPLEDMKTAMTHIAILAAEEERKACAEICIKFGTAENSPYGAIAWDCTEAIEARGKA